MIFPTNLRWNIFLIICCTLIIVTFQSHAVLAQGFSPNVQVNPELDGRPNLWGGKAVAAFGQNVYVLWTVRGEENDTSYSHTYLSTSTDGGETFNDGIRVSATGNQWFPSLAVDDSGVLYVAWTDEIGGDINGVSFSKSTDHGETFLSPVTVSAGGAMPAVAAYQNYVYILFFDLLGGNELLYFFARSTNGGLDFETPYVISDAPIVSITGEDMTDIFVDAGGTIYCVWNDGRRDKDGVLFAPQLTDIYIAKSTDNGVSFGTNVLVNDGTDAVLKRRFSSTVAVHDSDVYVAWQESDAEGHRRLLLAHSADGGASFVKEREISAGYGGSPALAVNNQGVVYLSYPGVQHSPPHPIYREGLFLSLFNGQDDNFPVTVIVSDQNTQTSNPSIFVDQNNFFYTIWADARNETNNVFFSKGLASPASPFALIEPVNGAHIIFTQPDDEFLLSWENALAIDGTHADSEDDASVYYLFKAALDPEFTNVFGEERILKSYDRVSAQDLGWLFAALKHTTGIDPDTVGVYWTISAVNEWGTTWSNDTSYISFQIDNQAPVDGFHLSEPLDNTVINVMVHTDTYTVDDGDFTFSWDATTDPDGDEVRYIWLLSAEYPFPSLYDDIFGDDEDEFHFFVFPSGEFEYDIEWEEGGLETFIKIPQHVAFNWFLEGGMTEKTFYWTVFATDGFGVYHWVPAEDVYQVTFKATPTSVTDLRADIPFEFYVDQNYPNPFNPATTIRFGLPEAANVRLEIFNLLGQRIATLIRGEEINAGRYEITWDASDIPSGTYIYRFQAGDYENTKKLMLIK